MENAIKLVQFYETLIAAGVKLTPAQEGDYGDAKLFLETVVSTQDKEVQ